MSPEPSSPDLRTAGPAEPGERDMTRTYVRVVVIQIVVLLALWVFSRHFS